MPDVLHTDLNRATQTAHPNQFATNLEHAVSTVSHGEWARQGDYRVWTYRVQVPGAKTLSFHADAVKLPTGSQLTQTAGDGQVFSYGVDVTDHGFVWSRIGAGDVMTVQIRVPLDAPLDPVFTIKGIQAGFLIPGLTGFSKAPKAAVGGPGDGREDTADPNQGCDTNYLCLQSAGNTKQGRSVVGIIVENTNICSGTLINDVPQDLKPFVITAAHCTGIPDTDNTNRATKFANKAQASVLYWRAETPCGTALQSITSSAVATTNVTTHRAEFNDSWLVEASAAPPAGAAPFWSGFDASDTNVAVGGSYGIHHAANKAKQIVSTNAGLTKVVSNGTIQAWQLIPNQGRVRGGGSGSGLFNPTGRIIGSDESGAGGCPGNTIGQQLQVNYSRLATAWNGNNTSARSFKPWLDPANTGTLTLDGKEDPARSGTPTVTIAGPATANGGGTATLTWTSTKSDSCTASGAWGGSKILNGTENVVTPNVTGNTTYTLTCTSADGNSTARSAVVSVTATAAAPATTTNASKSSLLGSLGIGVLLNLLAFALVALSRKQS